MKIILDIGACLLAIIGTALYWIIYGVDANQSADQ